MTSLGSLAVALLLLVVVLGLLVERVLRHRKEARAYLRGVRYVLSDDPDAAIAALSDAAQLGSPEAVDTYLALGALFRRTGDLARAIRLHRNMLMGPGLDPARRMEVERELAQDYRRGGMLDEALAAYRVLADAGDREAVQGLRDVLVDLGRMAEAAEVQRRLSRSGDDPLLAHLLAAQARSELPRDPERACVCAREALSAAPRSADALLALAEGEGVAGRYAEAREAVAAALRADPAAALLAWPALATAGPAAGSLALVDEMLVRRAGDPMLHYLRGRLLQQDGREHEAIEALGRALELDGTGEVTLAIRELLGGAAAPAPHEMAARHELMRAALRRSARAVRCRRCGAEEPTRQWRCSKCGAFETLG